jgi:ABC-type Zn uptake system ZnuABC Zn-binding protein ZnuA
MKKIFYILAALLLISCDYGYEMNDIDPMFSSVLASTSANDEEHAIEEIWKYVAENRIYIEVLSVDQKGNVVDINDVEDLSNVTKVRAIFSKEGRKKTLEWEPIDLENVFILFRE